MKPISPYAYSKMVCEELIKKHSNENDLVVDTFLGSGTTAIACKKTNRRFIGSELHEPYYEGALELINEN